MKHIKAWLQSVDRGELLRAVLGLGATLSALDWLLYDHLGFWGPAILVWWILAAVWQWSTTFQGCISLLSLIFCTLLAMLGVSQHDHHRPDYHQLFSDQMESVRTQRDKEI